VPEEEGQNGVVGHAQSSVHLERPVDHALHGVGHHEFDEPDIVTRLLGAEALDLPRGVERHEPRGLYLRRALGHPLLDDLARGQGLSVGRDDALRRARAQKVERAVADADPAHAVVYAPRTQALLRNHESVPLGAQKVFLRHAAVLVQDLAVAEVIASGVSHNGDVPHQVEARRVARHDDHARAQIRRGLGIGDRHDDRELGAVGRGAVPLLAVDYVIAAVLHRRGIHHDRVRAGHFDLGHREAASDFSLHQRPQIFLLLLLRSVFMQDFNIARVRRLTAEDEMPEGTAPQLLRHKRVLHEVEPHSAELLRVVGRPQLHLLHHTLLFLEDREHLPEVLRGELRLERYELPGDDLADHTAYGLHLFPYFKIHGLPPCIVMGAAADVRADWTSSGT